MCIIKFSTQHRNEIYDMTNNLKTIISVRRGKLPVFGVFISFVYSLIYMYILR